MDIRLSYSCLLGRPWIHKAGAVTSTIHQKLKYPVRGKIVTVQGEEEYMVSHLNSFRYIEMDGELDRKSTRLNSSRANISYAVFCLKKSLT